MGCPWLLWKPFSPLWSPQWSREPCHMRDVLITQECQVNLCLCVADASCFFFFFYTSPVFSAFYSSHSTEFRPVICHNAQWFLCQRIGKAVKICNCVRALEQFAHKRRLACLFLWRWWKVADLGYSAVVGSCSPLHGLTAVSQQELLCWCFTGNPNVQRNVWFLPTALSRPCFGLLTKKHQWNYL